MEDTLLNYPGVGVGLVDLDTSHPGSWVPILRELGCQVLGVFDSGTVWPKGYAKQFASQHNIPKVFKDLHEMADQVDLAIIHSCNWDLHLRHAIPFIEAQKAVFIDKPIAGNLKDLNQFVEWSRQEHRIYGGSSLLWCAEVAEYLSIPSSKRGEIHTVFAGCSVDVFNYGIHAYALLAAIMGPGIQSVQHLDSFMQHLIQVNWDDGRKGILSIGPQPGYLPFYCTIVTTLEVRHIQVDAERLYQNLLERTIPYLSGKETSPPIPFDHLIEPELMALAALMSRHRDRERIFIDQMRPSDQGYDGDDFARMYRQSRLRAAGLS